MFQRLALISLAGLFLPGICQASPIIIKKMTKGPKGYVIMVETPTGKHCWGMPQHLDLSKFPDNPMDVEAAAAKYNWPTPTGEQLKACNEMMHITWKVYSDLDQPIQPVYKVEDNDHHVHNKVMDTDPPIDHIDVNTPCGEYINNYGISTDLTYRQVTGKAGKQGAALCKKSQGQGG